MELARLGPRFIAFVLVAAVVLTACGGRSGEAGDSGGQDKGKPPAAIVEVKNFRYDPALVTVKAGEAVVWRFNDAPIAHDVKGDGFQSPIETEGSWSHQFSSPGRYDYQCTLHPFMTGTVEVR